MLGFSKGIWQPQTNLVPVTSQDEANAALPGNGC